MRVGFSNTDYLSNSINNQSQKASTPSLSFKGKIEPIVDLTDKIYPKLEFLQQLRNYEGNYFIKKGKEKNTFILKNLDAVALIEDSKSPLEKKHVANDINQTIQDFIDETGVLGSSAKREELRPTKDGKPAINKILDGFLEKLDIFHPEKIDDIGMLSFIKKKVIPAKKQTDNYIIASKKRKFGVEVKIKLPDFLEKESVNEIQDQLNENVLSRAEDDMLDWLIENRSLQNDLYRTCPS